MTPLFPAWDSAPVFLQCPHQACLQAVFLSFLAQWSWISEKLSYPGSHLINDQSSEISLLYWRKKEWVPLIIRAARNHWQVGNAWSWASQVAQWWICLPVQDMQELWVWALGQEDSLEEDMATHSSILAWEMLWTEEPVRLQSMGSQRVRDSSATKQQWQQSWFTLL